MNSNDRLRVATFNIRHGAPEDSYRGLTARLIEACAQLNADILGLQEVDAGVARSGFTSQAHAVARELGMTYVFRRARLHHFYGPYGNALLVRSDLIENVQKLKLHGDRRHHIKLGGRDFQPMWEGRNAIIADVTIGNWELAVANTHIGGSAALRRQHLARTALALSERSTPRLLLGDLNTETRNARAWLAPYGLDIADELPTSPASAPQRAIDHIAAHGLQIVNVETPQLSVSDHLAKVAELRRGET